ncbi:hypothetical protein, partial [Cutibacterium acnes]|uniref:hypothetical protein n=1 Tax=Cutibacterium acnes TaxID=1747 RepID=UPI00194E0303
SMASTVKDIGFYRARTGSTTQGLVIAGFILSVHHRQLRIIRHLTLYKEPGPVLNEREKSLSPPH